MPAKDAIHEAVKNALIKDGWVVTADPYILQIGDDDFYVDLAAEKLLAMERGVDRIAVEVKSFRGRSDTYEFHFAVGQFISYSTLIRQMDPGRVLFLAIPDVVYNNLFRREEVLEWITWQTDDES